MAVVVVVGVASSRPRAWPFPAVLGRTGHLREWRTDPWSSRGSDLGCHACVVHLLLWVAGVGGDQGCHHCGVHLLLCGAGVGGDLGCPSVGGTAFCVEKM